MWKFHTTQEAYVDKQLTEGDATGYTASGFIPYKTVNGVPQLLLSLEKPWNALTNEYDSVSLALFGGKRGPAAQEWEAHITAARWFIDAFGTALDGLPPKEELAKTALTGFAGWYPRGKYAVFIFEVKDDNLGKTDLISRFKEGKKKPAEEDSGPIRYKKAIEEIRWVPGPDILSKKDPQSNLLENLAEVDGIRKFLEGKITAETWGEGASADRPSAPKGAGKSKGKGKSSKGKSKGKGWNPMSQYGGGYFVKGGASMKGKSKGGFQPMPMMGMHSEFAYPEIQRQMIGEQLFALVQPIVPTPFLAQKITGMLLELPQQEQLPLLHIPQELKKRVDEAMLVLKDEGLDVA